MDGPIEFEVRRPVFVPRAFRDEPRLWELSTELGHDRVRICAEIDELQRVARRKRNVGATAEAARERAKDLRAVLRLFDTRRCPACGLRTGAPLRWGMPSAADFATPGPCFGGCVISVAFDQLPTRRCVNCGHEWSPGRAVAPVVDPLAGARPVSRRPLEQGPSA